MQMPTSVLGVCRLGGPSSSASSPASSSSPLASAKKICKMLKDVEVFIFLSFWGEH
jgi:hypothetical protein